MSDSDFIINYKNVTIDINNIPIPYRYGMKIGIIKALDAICCSIEKNMNIKEILCSADYTHICTIEGLYKIIKILIMNNYPEKEFLITAHEIDLF